MSRDVMQKVLEELEGIHPGNMTPMAEEYWNKAIADLREELAKPERTLTDADIETILIAYRAALPRHLCFARAVIRANNTKEKS